MSVHIKWFWKFCNILDINFLQKKEKANQEKFPHVVGGKKKGTTLQFILILLNTAEDLLCIQSPKHCIVALYIVFS